MNVHGKILEQTLEELFSLEKKVKTLAYLMSIVLTEEQITELHDLMLDIEEREEELH